MTLPGLSGLFGNSYQPRSPQGDGGYGANGMEQMGQQGSPMPRQFQRPAPPQNGGFQSGGPQTFAQMQTQGMARPAPQMVGRYRPPAQQGASNDLLQQKVAQTLQTPGRYDSALMQQLTDAATSQFNTQFGAQRQQIDETLAKRGILSSSLAGGYYGDLAGQQANAMASMRGGLLKDAADANATDNATALGAGQNFTNALAQNSLAGYNANVNAAQGNNAANIASGSLDLQGQQLAADTGLKVGELTGNYNGASTLGAQQQALNATLGLGNLGVSQQNANTQQTGTVGNLELQRADLTAKYGAMEADRMIEAQKIQTQNAQFNAAQAQQNAQFNANLELQRADLTAKYGSAGADRQIEQQKVTNQNNQFTSAQAQQGGQFSQQQDLAKVLGLGNLGVSQTQVQNQNNQFNVQQKLSEILGMGNLGLQQQQVTNQQRQFGQTLDMDKAKLALDQQVQTGQLTLAQKDQALRDLSNQQQYGLSKVAQDIQQSQFGQTFDLQKASLALDEQVRTGQLTLAQKDQALRELSNTQQYGLQQTQTQNQADQFKQSLAQQLGLATMSDKTANRGIDVQGQTASTGLILQLLQLLGLGGGSQLGGTVGTGIPTPPNPQPQTTPRTVTEGV